ncbi:hypothetical protein AcetOrient_orf04286 [Acetobacter orientalis]|uniref:Uncharacterized protein n=1 Tax=Acetobacter orientalis TaxID=146474 RepID=A0A2Z5ZKM2_9PROT|nr:hypothetical protein AcetOrient_orf04286 [Acetobacter orientalis]
MYWKTYLFLFFSKNKISLIKGRNEESHTFIFRQERIT